MFLAFAWQGAHAQWQPRLEGYVFYDNNIGRAQQSADQAHDVVAGGNAFLTRSIPLGMRDDASVGVQAGGQRYVDFDGASFASLGATAAWRRKLGLGRGASSISAQASLAREAARVAVRDASRADASLSWGRRLSEEAVASLGLAYDRREQLEDLPVVPGISGRPFSLQGRSAFARGTYAFGERSALVGELRVRHGDVESTSRRDHVIFEYSSAIAADPAIGPDFFAYRLSGADTRSLTGALATQLDAHAALQVALTVEHTTAADEISYHRTMLGVYAVYRP